MRDRLIVSRGSVRFSTGGLRAACLAADDHGDQHVEAWRMTRSGPRVMWRTRRAVERALAQIVALDDGRVVLSRQEPTGQVVELFGADGRGRTIATSWEPLRLLPPLGRPGWTVTAVSTEADGSSAVYRISDGEPWPAPVARIPARLGSAVVCGGRIVATALLDDVPTPIVIDPDTGAATPLFDSPAKGACRVVLAGGGHILLATGTGADQRLGLVAAHGPGHMRLLDGPGELDGTITPVALDPAGTTIALVITRGARSELALYDTVTETARHVAVPPGHVFPAAAWPGEGLWLPLSTPTRPSALGWLPPGETGIQAGEAPWQTAANAWSPGRVETFHGPAGPIEAVAYGPDWRVSDRVVVALHGGPDRHWTLEFDPLFQMFADAGLAVVAPNQRGSTGYGTAHAQAIVGAWGGPDLADIRELGRIIIAARDPDTRRPAVYGNSYGGFLALLTAAADPDAWSACAAVAPFRSVDSLYARASRPTRNLIDRLGGHPRLDDELGPRDLDKLVPRIRASVLIVHGLLDETIPVTQSRELVSRLISSGHQDVTYREPRNRGHVAVRATHADPLALELTRFLAQYDDVRPMGRQPRRADEPPRRSRRARPAADGSTTESERR